jgi:endonuclease/exonuclease/phosphatase family metal-dependent hydrolase
MLRGVSGAGALLGVMLMAGPTWADDPPPLTVMTFNLRYASATPPNAWPQRRPVVRDLLREYAPDLIGTQEGLYPQLKDIAADLPGYAWIGLGREGGSRGEFMAVFYKTDRLEPLEFDHVWLSDTPNVIGSRSFGNTLPRMVTWVRFRDRRTGQEFYCFNTHFDHRSQESREKSARLVLREVEKLKTTQPVLLIGDFNATAGANTVYDILVNANAFRDTWTTAKQRGEQVGTFHDFKGPANALWRIDWILARGPVVTLSTEVVTYQKDGQYPSDHFPVVAKVQLGDKP